MLLLPWLLMRTRRREQFPDLSSRMCRLRVDPGRVQNPWSDPLKTQRALLLRLPGCLSGMDGCVGGIISCEVTSK